MKTYARIDGGKVVEIIEPMADADGTEIEIERRFHPEIVAQLVDVTDVAEVEPGWAYEDGVFEPPAGPTIEQLIAVAYTQRDGLLKEAALRMAPLQDAVDLGEATASEAASLIAWKQYRVKLNRIHLQPNFPKDIDWPEVPA